MPDDLQSIIQKMVAAGEPEDNIAAVIQHYKAPAAPTQAAAPQQSFVDAMLSDNPSLPPMMRATQGALRLAKAHPVATGAMVGGALATGGTSIPASMALAGLGGAGGAGYGMLAKGAQSGDFGTPSGNAATMAKEGALSAAGEGVGQGAVRLAKDAGKLIYKTALRPSMGLQREFPQVAEVGLREGIPVSQGGAAANEARLGASADEARQMISAADAAGAPPVTTKEVAQQFGDVFKQGRNQAALGRPDPRPAVLDRLQAFDAKNPNGIPLLRAQDLKSEAQDLASRAYRAQDLGHPITDLSAASDKAMASGLRQGIEARVPGVAGVNAHTQELIGLKRALEDALRRNVPGVGSIRSLLGDFAPSAASHVGIGADRLGRSGVMPASFKTALIAALGGQQE